MSSALAACLLVACDVGDEAATPALAQLERLAFVPPGVSQWDVLELSPPRSARALLVDRFEVTRAMWSDWQEGLAPEEGIPASFRDSWGDGTQHWPASFMTFGEASRFAKSRGMRLPTASEWFFIAMGTRAQDWPWDQYASTAVANTLEMGLPVPEPCAVGVFELGSSSGGVYDLIGNVWEWVEGERVASGLDPGSESTWAAGGSYKSRARPLYVYGRESEIAGPDVGFHAKSLHREHRGDDVGLRCVAEAESFLVERLGRFGRGDLVERRLRQIGRGWGRSAIPLLTELSEAHPDAPALTFLLQGARE